MSSSRPIEARDAQRPLRAALRGSPGVHPQGALRRREAIRSRLEASVSYAVGGRGRRDLDRIDARERGPRSRGGQRREDFRPPTHFAPLSHRKAPTGGSITGRRRAKAIRGADYPPAFGSEHGSPLSG